MAASPGAGSGMPSSSEKMTRNRPSAWWSRTKWTIARVAGQSQCGVCSHPAMGMWKRMTAYSMVSENVQDRGYGDRGFRRRRRQVAKLGRVGPVDCDAQDRRQVGRIRPCRVRDGDPRAALLEHRRGAPADQAAGHDALVEDRQVGGQVQREAVAADVLVQL